eukprot:CAMPEP_0179900642 /NCGR_PEP_ID=MMETSP0982-20121206/39241_1 /TAXON_ID=483367 /ORGANISM="non described non described, Strain CCMP 2436" /LENGTH=174 /DNA_ID=CAMNT_0021798939 /DNA_START=866 /DNA_END=1389 /DNA_ORIENTATION=+
MGKTSSGVDLELLVEELEAARHAVDGHDDVLHHVLGDHRLANRSRHEELDEGNLGCAKPSEKVAVERVVAEGDQVVELPEDRARVPVVVVLDGEHLGEAWLARLLVGLVEGALDPLVVIRLVPQVARVHLEEPLAPRQLAEVDALDHGAVLGVDGALKVLRRLSLGKQRKALHL